MTAKTELYSLIDLLPENEILPAKRFLEFLIGNNRPSAVQVFLNAPYEDGPPDSDELDAIKEGEKDIEEGRTQSLESVMKEFGL
jgi:hypothetical protein